MNNTVLLLIKVAILADFERDFKDVPVTYNSNKLYKYKGKSGGKTSYNFLIELYNDYNNIFERQDYVLHVANCSKSENVFTFSWVFSHI